MLPRHGHAQQIICVRNDWYLDWWSIELRNCQILDSNSGYLSS